MKGKPSKLSQKELERKLLPCMAYLHGDVEDGQFRAACSYEYARESRILPKVAELFRRNRSADAMEIFFHIDRGFPAAGKHLIEHKWRVIWKCPSFPEKSWNELSKAERSDLLWGLPRLVKPLDFEKVFPIPSVDQLGKRSGTGESWGTLTDYLRQTQDSVFKSFPISSTGESTVERNPVDAFACSKRRKRHT
jgi:hypothetical protein